MPSAKSGKAGSAVAPINPKVPHEADKADPGEMAKVKAEQKESQSGKYGAPEEKPFKKSTDDEDRKSWIEIELVNEEGNPVAGEPFKVTLPDESMFSGTLNEKGFYRIEGIDQGTCKITFPNLDKDAWEKA